MGNHRRPAHRRATWSTIATAVSVLLAIAILLAGPWMVYRSLHRPPDDNCVLVAARHLYECG